MMTGESLETLFGFFVAGTGANVVGVRRSPFRYSTSQQLELLIVDLDDGRRIEIIRKGIGVGSMLPVARRVKPAFLFDQRREVAVYQHLLPLGPPGPPHCYGATEDSLLLERVPGLELYQLEADGWMLASSWLRDLHRSLAPTVAATGSEPWRTRLLSYDASYFGLWPQRAGQFLADTPDGKWVKALARNWATVIDRLTAMPVSLVHGDFYASNILIHGHRVAPVDWEMSGVGPALLDLAALVSGNWAEQTRAAIVDSYGEVDPEALDACRLQLAVQWLGWSNDWVREAKHSNNWLDEAKELSERLGIV